MPSFRNSNFIVEIITKIPAGRLNQWKMKCIKDLVDSKIFKLPLCRGILLPVFCGQIKDKLESKEEVSVRLISLELCDEHREVWMSDEISVQGSPTPRIHCCVQKHLA